MTAAVPLGVSKVIALKKMTEIVVIFLEQVTLILFLNFYLKIAMPLKIILLLLTEMVSLRGVNKVQACPQNKFLVPFQQAPSTFSWGSTPLGGSSQVVAVNLIKKTPAQFLLTTLLLYKKIKHTFLPVTFDFEMNITITNYYKLL